MSQNTTETKKYKSLFHCANTSSTLKPIEVIDAVPDFKTSRQNEQCINKKKLHIHRESMLNINEIYFHVLSPIGNLTVSIC